MPPDSPPYRDDTDPRGMMNCVMSAVRQMEDIMSGKGHGLRTGFAGLDRFTNGLQGGNVFVIAARPGMGKSTFSLNLVENISILRDAPIPGAIFSLEASAEMISRRMIATLSGIPFIELKSGILGASDFRKVMRIAGKVADAPIWIEDNCSLTIDEFQSAAADLKQKHDIGYLVVDYLQKIKPSRALGRGNREMEIAEICAGIKNTARGLNIPIFVIAQLGRRADFRGGFPRISDLRESCAIEEEADIVGLLARPEVYYDEEERESAGLVLGEAYLIIAKHRNGPTGEVPLSFNRQLMKFSDPPTESW